MMTEEHQQQLEAMILRNFLLVQADKHGHQLLAALPTIAGGDTPLHQPHPFAAALQFSAHIKSESEGDSSSSSNDENYILSDRNNGVSPPPLHVHGPQQLLHPLLQHHQQQLARVAFSRLASNGVSVIQKVGKVAGLPGLNNVPSATTTLTLKKESELLKLEEKSKSEGMQKIATDTASNVLSTLPHRWQGDSLLCQVCGERAGKHSYYGGQVCPSCRAFFRRSVQSRCNLNFKCINRSQSCHITLLTRKNCQYCRYQKCLESGMRPSWILSEEERIRRFHGRGGRGSGKCDPATSDQEEAATGTGTDSGDQQLSRADLICPAPIGPPSAAEISLQLGADERLQILQYGEVMRRCCSGRHDDLEPTLLEALVQSTQPGGVLVRSAAERLSTVIDARTRVCFTLFREFQSLCQSDQTAILGKNLPLVHRLRQAMCLASPNLSWRRVVCLVVGEEKVVETERQLPCDLSKKSGADKESLEYSQVFEAQGSASTQGVLLIVNQLKQLLSLNDPVVLVLISLITAFSPDFLDLENREQVENVQLKFVLLLQQHVCPATRTASADPAVGSSSDLVRLLMVPSFLRQMAELTKEMLFI